MDFIETIKTNKLDTLLSVFTKFATKYEKKIEEFQGSLFIIINDDHIEFISIEDDEENNDL